MRSFENMSLVAVVDPDANRATVLAHACRDAAIATAASELLHEGAPHDQSGSLIVLRC
jgi:hypothetical protein